MSTAKQLKKREAGIAAANITSSSQPPRGKGNNDDSSTGMQSDDDDDDDTHDDEGQKSDRNQLQIKLNAAEKSNLEMMKMISDLKKRLDSIENANAAATSSAICPIVSASSPPIPLASSSYSSSSPPSVGVSLSAPIQQPSIVLSSNVADGSVSAHVPKVVEVDPEGYQPTKLKRADANTREVLTQWLYEMEIYNEMRRVPSTDVKEYLRIAKGNVDKPMNLFLDGFVKEVSPNNEPLPWSDWKQFGKAIIKKLLPITSEANIYGELMRLEQSSSQSITTYLSKAHELMLQSGEFVRDEEQLVTTLHSKMDSNRYFRSHHELMIWMEDQRSKKVKITMDDFMMKAQKCELSEKPTDTKSTRRVNNIKTTPTTSDSSSSSSSISAVTPTDIPSIIAAVLQKMDDDKKECKKCGGSGHGVWNCTSDKEIRTCFRCEKVGHLANRCKVKKPATASDSKSKN